MENLATLPTDIWTLIADQLPLHEIHSFASVCRRFHLAAQWNISKYKSLSAIYAKVANADGYAGHHAEYLPDLLTKVVDEPAIGSCIRSLCIETTLPGGLIMTAGYPQGDRFRWELYRHAIRPISLQDSKTRDEMDWIWQLSEDSIVVALLFYSAPRMSHLLWHVHGFSHNFLMRFLSSKSEGRLGPGAQFLSRLTSVRLFPAYRQAQNPPTEGARQPYNILTLATVSMFLPLPSMRKVSCAHVSAIQMSGETKPKFSLPGTSTVRELKFDGCTIGVEKDDWLYKTIAAAKSLKAFRFTPEESNGIEFVDVLTALARTQSGTLEKLKLWSYGRYLPLETMRHLPAGNVSLENREPVLDLLGFPNLKYIDTTLDFICDLKKASPGDGQPHATRLPPGIERLKLRLVHLGQLEQGIQGLQDIIRQRSTTFPRLNRLHLHCHWKACYWQASDELSYDDTRATLSLLNVLHDRCKADNITFHVVAADGEIDFEDLNYPTSEVLNEDGDQRHGQEAFTLPDDQS